MQRSKVDIFFFMMQTSGTSNLADQPITNAYHEPRAFTDASPDLYPYLQHRNSLTPYAQRTTDLTVISTGLSSGVKTYIIMPPTIYGIGTGFFNRLTIQVPTIMRSALRTGQVLQLGANDGDVECVQCEDLADLYILMARRVVRGESEDMPSGARGIYFASTSRYTWGEFAAGIAKALFEVGGIKTKEVKKVGLEEAAKEWTGGHQLLCELNFGSKYVAHFFFFFFFLFHCHLSERILLGYLFRWWKFEANPMDELYFIVSERAQTPAAV
ncbi:MAG: hypothetical protein Q9205_000628 [Flavoplaca limonia]